MVAIWFQCWSWMQWIFSRNFLRYMSNRILSSYYFGWVSQRLSALWQGLCDMWKWRSLSKLLKLCCNRFNHWKVCFSHLLFNIQLIMAVPAHQRRIHQCYFSIFQQHLPQSRQTNYFGIHSHKYSRIFPQISYPFSLILRRQQRCFSCHNWWPNLEHQLFRQKQRIFIWHQRRSRSALCLTFFHRSDEN